MRYLDVYYEYLKVIDKKKNALGAFLAAKEDENAYKIIHFNELKRKFYNALIIANVLFMSLSGLVYSFVKEYYSVYDMLYYGILAILVNVVILIVIFILKMQIKKLKNDDNSEEGKLLKEDYRKECEKIYHICPFLIVVNENYYELESLDTIEKKKFYKEKVLELRKTISFNAKGNINTTEYQDYLEKWIVKNKE